MVGGNFVQPHKAPESIFGHLCQWRPTQAKPLCTPISWHSANITKYNWGRAVEPTQAQEKNPYRAMDNMCVNYLQVVTKDTLENQVGLGICMARFALHYRIIGAHSKHSRFQLPLQLGAKCLVISRLTISILEILRRHCIPLATDPHTTTGINSRGSNDRRHTRTGVNNSNSNNSKSNSNSCKVGRPKLAQRNTNLRLTQDGRIQGTMKNLAFKARHVRCAITSKACVNGSKGPAY